MTKRDRNDWTKIAFIWAAALLFSAFIVTTANAGAATIQAGWLCDTEEDAQTAVTEYVLNGRKAKTPASCGFFQAPYPIPVEMDDLGEYDMGTHTTHIHRITFPRTPTGASSPVQYGWTRIVEKPPTY